MLTISTHEKYTGLQRNNVHTDFCSTMAAKQALALETFVKKTINIKTVIFKPVHYPCINIFNMLLAINEEIRSDISVVIAE